jgi:glutathione S-transferase
MPAQYAHHACGAAKVPLAMARPLRSAGMARHSPPLRAARKRRSAKRDTSEIEHTPMTRATLTITSKNYSSWSLRGWLLARFAGIEFDEKIVPADDPAMRAELLLLSSSILVPCLTHNGIVVWDTLAIGEYLNEALPQAGLLPRDPAMRARCRSICGEMHSGFTALRSSLPMNIKARFPGFRVWSRAQSDIDRISTIWKECLSAHGGPFLFGERSMADAMYAPVCTRFQTYDVTLAGECAAYCKRILDLPEMVEWADAACQEPEEIEEFEVEF